MFAKINPQLVAHRGYSSQYPENTLLAIEQAFIAGACFVECDVQLTQDGVPVLLHDVTQSRTIIKFGISSKSISSTFPVLLLRQVVPDNIPLIYSTQPWPQQPVAYP